MALDTASAAPREVIEAVPAHVDLILADLKLVGPAAHRRWTGLDNADILAALRHCADTMPGRLSLIVPLVPEVHTSDEVGRLAARLAAGSSAAVRPGRIFEVRRASARGAGVRRARQGGYS